MRYITIEKALPGMKLAKPVYDNLNHILLSDGSELSKEYIDNLKRRGYPGIYITDSLTEDIFIEETISAELRNKGVEALRNNDIDTTLEVAKKIVDQILHSKTVSLDMVDLRTFDDYTYRHSVNVAVMSGIIGMYLNLNETDLVNLCVAGILHDLGKLMIDPQILNKPARLTKEEFQCIKDHPALAVELIKDRWNVSATSRSGIMFHHENEDGSGYPKGLVGDEIHLFAKIIHVADVYDALTSKRPYKKPYDRSEAIEYLLGGANILFDEKVVHAFTRAVPVYPKGISVYLSDGREAVIVENTSNPIRPKIRLLDGKQINLNEARDYRNITIQSTSNVQTDFSDEIGIHHNDLRQECKKILIVDDMVTNLQLLRSVLENSYKVIMVKSGIQALDYLKTNEKPNLILMDVDLPVMNGIETVKRIREEIDSDIKVIFVTALSDRQTVLKCQAQKAIDYIVRPFHSVYVQERIRLA
ncbi:MAG: response regulator, partial [Clostridiales bacterium]|nr:response regulator [Clostridiales bacterium]